MIILSKRRINKIWNFYCHSIFFFLSFSFIKSTNNFIGIKKKNNWIIQENNLKYLYFTKKLNFEINKIILYGIFSGKITKKAKAVNVCKKKNIKLFSYILDLMGE